jgi:ribonuclease HI
MGKQKYYVVWEGLNPGIYTDWTNCLLQTKGVKGAKYKSFNTREEAEKAFAASPSDYITKKTTSPRPIFSGERILPKEVNPNSLAVDAACSGNPGKMEYRGVHIASGQEIFHFGPAYGTNNIGEFLAIVHGLAFMKQNGFDMPLYSDSRNAINWVKAKKCRTKLPNNAKTKELFDLITRAENWLKNNTYSTSIIKWETSKWGEIPADFGRK